VTDDLYVTLSSAISLDGYLDTADPPRLTLSNSADFDRVDEVRSRNDAILVGARTVRRDNPRLLVRSAERRDGREAAGLISSPWKVTVTASGDLDPRAEFFATGDTAKLVYCPGPQARRVRSRLGDVAIVVGLGSEVTMADLVADLSDRGARRLMVEGGGTVHTQFLSANLVDELQLAVAPLFVGDRRAPRFVGDAAFPWTGDRRARLAEVRPIGDIVLLRYALSTRFVQDNGQGPDQDAGGLATSELATSTLARSALARTAVG
jgi:5-amino-6-(5-phosphoribosylamino)uracil reductase